MNKISPLQAELVPRSGGSWKLLKPLIYDHPEMRIEVPAGFVTDLDSVPRLPFAYWVFKGRSVRPAIVHDYLYRTHPDRRLADEIFYDAMRDSGVPLWQRSTIWAAVRAFGWTAHKKEGGPALTDPPSLSPPQTTEP